MMTSRFSGFGGERKIPNSQLLYQSALEKVNNFHDQVEKYYLDSGMEVPDAVSDFLREDPDKPTLFFLHDDPINIQSIEGADALWPSTIIEDKKHGIICLTAYFAKDGKLVHPATQLEIPDEYSAERWGTSPVMIIIPKEGPVTWLAYVDLVAAEDAGQTNSTTSEDHTFVPELRTFQRVFYESNGGLLRPTGTPFTDRQSEELYWVVEKLKLDINGTLINNGLEDYK